MREAIAAGILIYKYLPGKGNPADILSKIRDTNRYGVYYNLYYFGKEKTMDLVINEKEKDIEMFFNLHGKDRNLIVKFYFLWLVFCTLCCFIKNI